MCIDYTEKNDKLKSKGGIFMYEKMFEPIKIRGMEMKNRVVYSAAGTKFSGKQGSFVTDQLIIM